MNVLFRIHLLGFLHTLDRFTLFLYQTLLAYLPIKQNFIHIIIAHLSPLLCFIDLLIIKVVIIIYIYFYLNNLHAITRIEIHLTVGHNH